MYHSKLKSGNTLAVVFLLVISLAFRFVFSATHISFGQDIARDNWLIQQRISNNHYIVDYGPKASVGNFYLPPLYYQLHVFFSLISNNDPLTMKWIITFVEALSPALLFLLLKGVVDSRLAVLTSLIYIVAPMPLQYGTTAWNPNMIPFVSLLLLYAGVQISTKKQLRYIPIACVAFVAAFQFHYQAAVLLPFIVYIFFISIWKYYSKKLVLFWFLGMCLAFASIAPYFVAEIRSDFKNTQAIITYFTQEHAQYYERVSKPDYLLTYFPKFFDRVLFSKESFHTIFGICIYFGGTLMLIRQYRTKKQLSYLSILFYFGSIFIMLRVFKGDKLDYYLSTLYFIPFVLLASLLNPIRSKLVLGSLFGLIMLILGTHVGQWKTYDDLTGLRQTVTYIQNKAPTQSVRLLFHDDDFVNTLFYGLQTYTQVRIDPGSTSTVDICNTKDVCAWDTTLNSKHSLAYSQIGLYKADAQYTQMSHRYGKVPFQVIIGTIANTGAILNNSGFTYQGEQGSDFLMSF